MAVYSLVDHGAACDGSTVDTAAFRSAFSAAAAAVRGGASAVVVRVPRGKQCLTAPFNISVNRTTLYLEAGSTVKASDDPTLRPRTAVHPWPTYGPSRTLSCFIGMFSVHGSGIAGPGAIDMNGEAWHGGKLDPKNDFLDLPHFLLVYNSSDVLLRGARLLNGACWNLHLLYSTRCTIDRLRIETPFKGTDGIDVDSSTHVTIANTYISNGDEYRMRCFLFVALSVSLTWEASLLQLHRSQERLGLLWDRGGSAYHRCSHLQYDLYKKAHLFLLTALRSEL